MTRRTAFLLILVAVLVSPAWAITNHDVTIIWTPTTDARILYDIRMMSFANGWKWEPVKTGVDSRLGRVSVAFGPYADSMGDRGLCIDAQSYWAQAPAIRSRWLSEDGLQACNQVPNAAAPSPAALQIPTPDPGPAPSPAPAPVAIPMPATTTNCERLTTLEAKAPALEATLTQMQTNLLKAQQAADAALAQIEAIRQAACTLTTRSTLRKALRTALGGCN